jgi:peptidoglycan/xylan/chitin deacetylase (PgdA/CDA1 family)
LAAGAVAPSATGMMLAFLILYGTRYCLVMNITFQKFPHTMVLGEAQMKNIRMSMKDKSEKGDSPQAEAYPENVETLVIPGPHKRNKTGIIVAIFCVLVSALAALSVWFWWNNYRKFSVQVNNIAVQVTGKQSLSDVLTEHQDFNKKPGKLLSLSGKTLESKGGAPISVRQNGTSINAEQLGSTYLHEHDSLIVQNGKDVSEKHKVHEKDIPFSTSITTGGAIQFVEQQGKTGKQEYWVGDRSGEQVDKTVTIQPTELKINSLSPKPPADKKVIALTFDDGPSNFTAPILNILKSKGAKATFFDIGKQSAEMPQMERQILADGNQVASHSNSHPDLTTLGRDSLRTELETGFNAINTASNTKSRMLRAPYGAFNKQCWTDAADMVSSNIIWTTDTLDWKKPGEQEIKDQVLKHAYSGAIVLMHDGGGDRTEDVNVLPSIIDSLHAQGYELVTVDDLIKMDGRFPKWVANNEVAPQAN